MRPVGEVRCLFFSNYIREWIHISCCILNALNIRYSSSTSFHSHDLRLHMLYCIFDVYVESICQDVSRFVVVDFGTGFTNHIIEIDIMI